MIAWKATFCSVQVLSCTLFCKHLCICCLSILQLRIMRMTRFKEWSVPILNKLGIAGLCKDFSLHKKPPSTSWSPTLPEKPERRTVIHVATWDVDLDIASSNSLITSWILRSILNHSSVLQIVHTRAATSKWKPFSHLITLLLKVSAGLMVRVECVLSTNCLRYCKLWAVWGVKE